MKRIKVAQIGCGCQHSGQIMQCMLKHPELFEVAGVADTDGYGGHPDFDGVPRLTEEEIFGLKGLDAIIVEPEEHFLLETAQRCIDRGFPIHMDKPGGEDYEGFRRLMSEAKRKKLLVHMGYMYRTNPAVLYAFDMVRSGALGQVIAIDTAMSTDHPDFMKAWLGTFQGGTMYILGCHMIDMILTLMGDRMPERILSFRKKTGFHNIDVCDNSYALLEYPEAICTVRINSSEINGYGRRHLVVNGEKGSIEIMPLEGPIRANLSLREDVKSPFAEVRRPLYFQLSGRYDAMMWEFVAILCGEIENPYSYEHEVALHKAHLIACGFDGLDLCEPIIL